MRYCICFCIRPSPIAHRYDFTRVVLHMYVMIYWTKTCSYVFLLYAISVPTSNEVTNNHSGKRRIWQNFILKDIQSRSFYGVQKLNSQTIYVYIVYFFIFYFIYIYIYLLYIYCPENFYVSKKIHHRKSHRSAIAGYIIMLNTTTFY